MVQLFEINAILDENHANLETPKHYVVQNGWAPMDAGNTRGGTHRVQLLEGRSILDSQPLLGRSRGTGAHPRKITSFV